MGMSARNHKTYKGWFQVSVFYVICTDMPFNVMHADQRNPRCKTDRFRRRHAHQKRTHKPRAISNCDSIHVGKLFSCLQKRLRHHLIDLFDMLAGRNLRNHTPVERMQIDLGGYHIGQHFPAVFHHSRGCLITGSLHSQNRHGFPDISHLFLHSETLSAFSPPQAPSRESSSDRPRPV